MSRESTESAEDDESERETEESTQVPTAVVIVVFLLGCVLTVLVVTAVAVALTAVAAVLGRWTGLGATHLLAALLTLLVSVVLIWRLGRLIEAVERARQAVEWLIGEQEARGEMWEQLLRGWSDDGRGDAAEQSETSEQRARRGPRLQRRRSTK